MNQRLRNNKIVSDRTKYIKNPLNKSLQIKPGYAPTSNSGDKETETFDKDLIWARGQEETHFVIITEDFNGNIGTKEQGESQYIGHFGLYNRNEREELLYNYLKKKKPVLTQYFL